MKGVRLAVGIVVAIVLLYLTVRNMQFQSAVEIFLRVDVVYLFVAVVLLAFAYTVRIYRWTVMLKALDGTVTWRRAAGPFMASFALNNVLPFRIGDLMRCFGFQNVLAIKPPRVLGSLLVERILDLVTLLSFFAITLWRFQPELEQSPYLNRSALVLTLILIPLVVAILAPGIPAYIVLVVRRLPVLAHIRLVRKVSSFALRAIWSFKVIGTSGRMVLLLLLSVVGWLLEGSVYFAVVVALHGSARWTGPFFAMVSGTLATLIPSTPGYVGTFDLFAKLGLTTFGETATRAAVEALTIHAVLWLPVTLAGLAYIAYTWGIVPALRLIAERKTTRTNVEIV